MVLTTMQKVAAIAGAVVTAVGVTYGVTSLIEDTVAGPNAAIVDCRFKRFNREHGADLRTDKDFQAVLSFFKNPYSAKLFRVVDSESETVSYIYVAKGEKNAEGHWTAGSWKAYKNTAKEARSTFTVGEQNIQKLLNNKDVLKDWEAVNAFMNDWKEAHKPKKKVTPILGDVKIEEKEEMGTEGQGTGMKSVEKEEDGSDDKTAS